MTRLVPLILMFVLVVVLAGCGAVFVGFVSNPGATLSITGTVTIVQLGFAGDGQDAIVNVTMVTLVNLGTIKTMNFCGDQQSLFPINQSVRAEFTSGTPCSTVLSVAFFPPSGAAIRSPFAIL